MPLLCQSTVGIKCSFLDEAGELETWEFQGGASANINNWMKTGTKAFYELGKNIQSIFGTLFANDATGTDLVEVSKFILEMKYEGTDLNPNDNYSIYECRKDDSGQNLLLSIKKEDNTYALYSNTFKLEEIPTDYTKGFHKLKLADFCFIFNWNCFKDFLYTKGAYPLRKLNNAFVFGQNVQKQLDQITINKEELEKSAEAIGHIQKTYISKENIVIDGVNLYNISKNTTVP